MSERHVGQPGDHVSRIADENGFGSWETLWDHPDNAELKAKRKNPNVLAEGDEVAIPEKKKKQGEEEEEELGPSGPGELPAHQPPTGGDL